MPDKRRRLLRDPDPEEEDTARPSDQSLGVVTWAEHGNDMDMDWDVLVRVKRLALEAELERERKIAARGL